MATKKPNGIISIQQAQEYHQNYKGDNKKRMKNNQQTVFGWHSLEDYKNYIAYIEEQAEKRGVIVSGIRVYFGSDQPINGSKKGQLTYFFAPTFYDEKTKQHEAFGTFALDENNKPMKVHQSIVSKMKVNTSTDDSVLWNRSTLCPPFCQGDDN